VALLRVRRRRASGDLCCEKAQRPARTHHSRMPSGSRRIDGWKSIGGISRRADGRSDIHWRPRPIDGPEQRAVTAVRERAMSAGHIATDVAVHAPTGRDGQLTVAILERWGLTARLCVDMKDLCDAITEDIGVLMVAEEALRRGSREQLLAA